MKELPCLEFYPQKRLRSQPCLAHRLSVLTPPKPTPWTVPFCCAWLGGWPASAECSHARAVFIRRITPWPIEPPLQIWRCPMGAVFKADSSNPFESRLYKALARSKSLQGQGPHPTLGALPMPDGDQPAGPMEATITPLVYKLEDNEAQHALEGLLTNISQQADIDISDPAFDFARSLRVYHMQYRQSEGRDECKRFNASRLGSYGAQGDYRWQGYNLIGVTYERIWVRDGRDSGWRDIPHYSWNVPSQSSIHSIPVGGCNSINIRAVGVSWTDWEGNPGYEEVHY